MLRVFIVDKETEDRIRRVVNYAIRKENYYYIGKSDFVPGNCPKYVVTLSGCRCVFSISVAPRKGKWQKETMRHLSISLPDSLLYPHEILVWTIALEFGFTYDRPLADDEVPTRPSGTWLFGLNETEHAVVVVEPYRPA